MNSHFAWCFFLVEKGANNSVINSTGGVELIYYFIYYLLFYKE